MGKRILRGWQGPKAGRWGGWTGRRGDGEGWMATGSGRQGGGIWKGAMRKGRWRGEQQGREEGGNGEGDNVRRRWRGGQWGRGEDGKGAMGKQMGMGRRRGKGIGDFTDGYDGMSGWT